MSKRVFYDTCVFLLSGNEQDKDHVHCAKLVDTHHIKWVVVYSWQTLTEATIAEFMASLVMQWASLGVDFIEVSEVDTKGVVKKNKVAREALEKLGVGSHDRKQVFAAVASTSTHLLTRDADLIDPENKSGRKRQSRVKKLIQNTFNIPVLVPSEAFSELAP